MPGGLGHYKMELPDSHDLPAGPPLSARWQARVGQRWLMVNDLDSAFLALSRQSPLFGLGQIQGLEGYLAALVNTAGIELVQIVDPRESDDRARTCLKIPLDNGWGLNNLVIEDRDGEEWVIWGSLQYRPLATVPPLELGQSRVTLGSEGLGEWRQLPAASTLTLAGAGVWYLYDREFTLLEYGRKDKTVHAAGYNTDWAYLLVGGQPGLDIQVTLSGRTSLDTPAAAWQHCASLANRLPYSRVPQNDQQKVGELMEALWSIRLRLDAMIRERIRYVADGMVADRGGSVRRSLAEVLAALRSEAVHELLPNFTSHPEFTEVLQVPRLGTESDRDSPDAAGVRLALAGFHWSLLEAIQTARQRFNLLDWKAWSFERF
jgi:hypothetical protein